jgi:4-alpha-glucanotransferase
LIQFKEVKQLKEEIFRKAYDAFVKNERPKDYDEFVYSNREWLIDYTLFMAIKTRFDYRAWSEWNDDIAQRCPEAVKRYADELKNEIGYQEFLQYCFFKQWKALKSYANSKGIKIIGDLPIFISNDSSDVWAKRELFEVDNEGKPIKVAGVPPDFFSTTGQYWGNPHYRWDIMAQDDYQWWRERFKMLIELVDIIRIDHFRGFEAYWEIGGSEKTAEKGRWVKGPGSKFFNAIERYLGKLPIIVEDLGFITEEVNMLKNEFGYPGMKILQFCFGSGSEERFLPHHYEANSVVYTGTHDNDTTAGWFESALKEQRAAVDAMKSYFGITGDVSPQRMCWILIEAAFQCNSNFAMIPMQDILSLGTESRMNIPSTIGGNWGWRFESSQITPSIINQLKELSMKYNRNTE